MATLTPLVQSTVAQTTAMPSDIAQSSTPQALQLHDIHLPEQINTYPLAPGWWLLAIICFCMVVWALLKYKKQRKLNQYKKIALTQLTHNKNLSNTDIIQTLKWVAMQYFPRAEIAKLYSKQFQQYLQMQLTEKNQHIFIKLTDEAFTNQYMSSDHIAKEHTDTIKGEQTAPLNQMKEGAIFWINKALPPKKSVKTKADKEKGAQL